MPVCRIALMLAALPLVCVANAAGPESDHARLAANSGTAQPPLAETIPATSNFPRFRNAITWFATSSS
jgi:hypothetical protein